MTGSEILQYKRMLKDPDYRIRWSVVELLDHDTGRHASSLLIEALGDRNREVQQFAAEALGRKRCRLAIPTLKELLGSKRSSILRAYLIDALVDIGDPCAGDALIPLFRSKSEIVRAGAAAGIGMLRYEAGEVSLRRLLNRERSPLVRLMIQSSLYQLGHIEFLSSVLLGLKHPGYRVRCATANRLSELANERSAVTIRRALKAALREEPTHAARSSIRNTLRTMSFR